MPFFSVGTSADDESRRRRDDGRKGEPVGRIHRRREKRNTATRAAEGVEKCQPANWKRGLGRGEEDREAGDSLRQPRRQINMPGRAISNIRRSHRVGASCVRARELRWWRPTAGRIRDSLARPIAIASADRKVNGRRPAGIKDVLSSSSSACEWWAFQRRSMRMLEGFGKTRFSCKTLQI